MKKVLVIIPYENIYPPLNGGMQRCFHILRQMVKYFEVTAIIHQEAKDFMKATIEFPVIGEVKIYSTHDYKPAKDLFSILPKKLQSALRYRWLRKSWKGPADSNFLKYYNILKYLLTNNEYDAVLLENLATLNTVKIIRRFNKNASIVYDAHNVDTNLALEDLKKGLMKPVVFKLIRDAESTLNKKVDGLMVCSNKDLVSFTELNKGALNAVVIPNGATLFPSLQNAAVKSGNPCHIIFCGSLDYTPNAEGLLWFYKSIWPLIIESMPTLKLIVLGSGKLSKDLYELQKDPALWFTGRVFDVKPYYNKAAISIVPLKSGSGTRLKILEAMSLGVPVIATSKGAEGINYTRNEDIIIADDEQGFACEVINLLSKSERRLLLAGKARMLIEKQYNWDIVGHTIRKFINKH